MRTVRYAVLTIVLGMILSQNGFSQQAGDYRSAATGNWSDASTWESFDGANWVAAGAAPTGAETITVLDEDTARVDVAVTITGYLKVEESGVVEVTSGSLEFGGGSTYEHARDEGSVPTSTWNLSSTFLITGTVGSPPDNINQNYYNITLNTPNMTSNEDLGLDDVTIGGKILVQNTGVARWRLTSAPAQDTSTVTILGDVIVEDGSFETQGTGNALTTFFVHHYGNITVTGGTFGISRGSQGNGSGTTTWNLFGDSLSVSNAELRNSNPAPGNAKFVFAKGDTQQITFENVEFTGGDIHYEVSDTSTMQINQDFQANGLLVNKGDIYVAGTLTLIDGGVYDHAQDGGSVPTATWEAGSTALFTGITSNAPDNRGQDYFNLTLNTPDMLENEDMSLDGNTISGDVTLLSSGNARWRLVGGNSGTVTILGDVIVQDGSLETLGTSSPTEVEVRHHGNVNVTGGTFAVSRGSQGGVGTTKWFLLEGDFSIADATARNSNPDGATFVFANEGGIQNITLTNVDYGSGGLPIQVDSAATINMGTNVLGGEGNFTLSAWATLASGHPDGLDGSLQTTGEITLSKQGSFIFNGTEAQVPGTLLPDSLNVLTISNLAGVAFNDTLRNAELIVSAAAVMQVDTLGSVTADSGSVAGTIVNEGVLEAIQHFVFEDGSVYEHARDEGSIPTGIWNEGSTLLMTGTIDAAPGNRNQSYYNITFNTPDMASNRDMALDDVTIGGNIKVENTGSARWRLTSASATDTSIVTIMGDVIVEEGSFETQGTGNAFTVFEVHHHGDVVVTGGNFSVARGSQGSGSGSTRWFLHEGNFSMSNATTQNSNSSNAWFEFDKDGVQTIELADVTYGGGGLAIEVASATTLDFGVSELGGSGLFTLNESASLATAHADGIAGTVQTTGTVTLNEGASYIFNGTDVQVTSTLMPATVNGLTIDNEAGVELSQQTTINGVLRLVAGVFNNIIPFTLGVNGSISFEGGSLLVPVSVEQLPDIPTEFALFQNYPNPFNPATTVRYDVPKRTHVTLKIYDVMGREVAELVNDQHELGAYEVVWNAKNHASGIYYYRISAGDFTSVRRLVLTK